jgi:hypothetical protein
VRGTMTDLPFEEYRLEIGEVVIGLAGQGRDFVSSLEEYFGRRNLERESQVRLRLRVHRTEVKPIVPSSLYAAKKPADGGGFRIGDDLVLGRFDPRSGEADLHVADALMNGRSVRVFEQLLYQAYHSAAASSGGEGVLLHAAAIVRNGAGYAFVGTSGAGKSTLARLCAEHTVLNDEIALVHPYGSDEPQLVGTPLNGFFKEKKPGAAPLRAVFLLQKAAEPRVRELGPGEMAAALTAQIVPPIGLGEFLTEETTGAMFERARWLVERVPARILEFRPEPDFWTAIDDYLA